MIGDAVKRIVRKEFPTGKTVFSSLLISLLALSPLPLFASTYQTLAYQDVHKDRYLFAFNLISSVQNSLANLSDGQIGSKFSDEENQLISASQQNADKLGELINEKIDYLGYSINQGSADLVYQGELFFEYIFGLSLNNNPSGNYNFKSPISGGVSLSNLFEGKVISKFRNLFGNGINFPKVAEAKKIVEKKSEQISEKTKAAEVAVSNKPEPKVLAANISVPTSAIKKVINNYLAPTPKQDAALSILPNYVTKKDLDSRLKLLSEEFIKKISAININPVSGDDLANIYRQIALTQRIDQISNVTINNSYISSGSVGGVSVTNIVSNTGSTSIPNLVVNNTSTSTFAGGVAITGGCISVNGTCVGGGGGSGTPGGSDGQIQFNSGGTSFGGSSSLVWDNTNLRLGVGTTSPYAPLSVVGQIVAAYFTATTTLVNTFPYASTTALSVSSGLTLNTSTNGPLQAVGGIVSATTSIGVAYGGTGWASLQSNAVLLGNGSGKIATTSAGTDGQVLALVNGVPTWQSTTTLSTITGTLTVGKGGTNATSFSANSIVVSDAAGTTLIATGSKLTIGSLLSTTTATSTFSGALGIGTTSPWAVFSVNPTGGTAAAQFVVGSSSATNLIVLNSGFVGISSTTPTSRFGVNPQAGDIVAFAVGSSTKSLLSISTEGFGTTTLAGLNVNATATSTSNVGWNISNGCYAISGTCLSLSNLAGTLAVSKGGTNATSFAANSIIVSDAAGTTLIATTSNNFTLGSFIATSTTLNSYSLNNWTGFGTSTPVYEVTISSSTAPQLALSAGSGIAQWVFRNGGGDLYLATTTVAGTATTSITALTISGSGFGTTTIRGLTIANGQATSTSNVGWSITNGCYAIGTTCLSLSSLTGTLAVASGGTNSTSFAANSIITSDAAGTTLIATTSNNFTLGSFIATSTTLNSYSLNNWIGFGTTTSKYPLTISSSTASQLALSASSGFAQVVFRNDGTNFYIATTTTAGTATTSTPAMQIAISTGNVGFGTTTSLGPLTMNSGAFVTTGGTWTNASDRNLKENFVELDINDILNKIMQLPITQWNYKSENINIPHIGPVAQDFHAIFGLGNSDTSISTIDPAGVALVGIKALYKKIEDIGKYFADNVLKINKVSTENLCVSDDEGETCITRAELLALLSKSKGQSSNTPPPTASTTLSVPQDTSAPVITILGDNPAQIVVGSTYSDMGATVSDTNADGSVNNNLGLHYTVNGLSTDSVSIDTATSSSHTVVYSAVDSSGNWGYATRTVEVKEAVAP